MSQYINIKKAVTMHTLFLYLRNIFNTRDDKKYICAVGFEPNPNHVLPLREIESSFAKCGWRTKFFTKTAVSNYTGKRTTVGSWYMVWLNLFLLLLTCSA